ncbi:Pectinesterase, catalytic [Penicillium digitatum]|uniref:pectinesterase n=3 Tax=Penicillium digitatum TaxID=36651 RepID=K9GS62_PEND2|nr:hypothetical protein PDIP_02280 [Penicillium digitatum Pd1]EKV17468.1 hypothetical protein PDIG_14830 [Penicillium digitatum PHI26]EKV21857.1 hypothetical protein PDIP_02280 [Penicillium digitatum Pd1]QQK47705.1 Pectinesterase, catalytic [Penicillium digitatum]
MRVSSVLGFTGLSVAYAISSLAVLAAAAPVIAAPASDISASTSSTSATIDDVKTYSPGADTTWLDSTLMAAGRKADAVKTTFVVNPKAGPYKSVTAAIAALPSDGQEYTIYITAGTYNEQISITRAGKTILRGETKFENDYTENTVTISYSNGKLTSASKDEETPVITATNTDGKGLAIYNINFRNTYPQTPNTAALAADFYGTVQAYGCSFYGFQDTLLANKGTQVFSNCYIEGNIDFIWGYSTAYFYQSVIASNTPGSCIAAMSRPSSAAPGGYVFDSCVVTYTSKYGETFENTWLGRPYSSYSRVIYMNSYLDKHINSEGWHEWSVKSPQTEHVTFGEYNNSGPGSWSGGRASFATSLTKAQADAYSLSNWVGGTSWLDMAAYESVPSYKLPRSL